jgi:hypothetical protein
MDALNHDRIALGFWREIIDESPLVYMLVSYAQRRLFLLIFESRASDFVIVIIERDREHCKILLKEQWRNYCTYVHYYFNE